MRYFIVFFDAEYNDEPFKGNMAFESIGFLSMSVTSDVICEEFGFDDVCITNLMEITAEDYNDWNYKGENILQ